MYLVKLACEMPETSGTPVSQWDCKELARKLVADGIVRSISPDTVQRILQHHKLKPWRKHVWLGAKAPRDEAFLPLVRNICDLYTRALEPFEVVISVDEKTSIQPRPRVSPTQPAQPGKPIRVEHEYERSGALNLIAGFDTRSGKVFGRCYARKRAIEFIDFLEGLDRSIDPRIQIVNVVLDNVRVHKSMAVLAWLVAHPRFRFHFPPVHCSWMNQVEQWFGTLQRKRLGISDFASLEDLEAKILNYIDHYNAGAKPYNWTTKSVTKVMAWAERSTRQAA